MKIEKYNKDLAYSFTLGAFPTFELMKNNRLEKLIIHSKLKISDDINKLLDYCSKENIEIIRDDKLIAKLSDKENTFIIGMFNKYTAESYNANKNIVLVNPSDMGNMGTIMRTMLGFGFKDLIIIKPAVDHFNPKVVRASMGAIFSLNIHEFDSLEDYLRSNDHKKYFFMLNGKQKLGHFNTSNDQYDLVFGNEATGLPPELLEFDESVVIEHTKDIDSLNLPISVAIALYQFSN